MKQRLIDITQSDAEVFKAWLRERRDPIWQAQFWRATGDYVLYVRQGPEFVRVTDQKLMDDVMRMPALVAGEKYWFIAKRDPEPSLLRELNTRLMGLPKQQNEHSGPGGGPIAVNVQHIHEAE